MQPSSTPPPATPAEAPQLARESATRDPLHQIVVVGGGAGGLELVTRLGDTLDKRGKAAVTLVDRARAHVWKPKLHEIAAGSMDIDAHDLDYLAQARWHHFRYRVGEMIGLDRANKRIHVAPFTDDDGNVITPERTIRYDTLVMALGSQSNDFGTPGVAEYAMKLETAADARRFHRRLVNNGIRVNAQMHGGNPYQMHIAIIGAGATGVELAAELHRTTRELVAYGLDKVSPENDLRIHLIEAADRILPGLTPKVSAASERMLRDLGVQVHTKARVAEVRRDGVRLADETFIPAEMVVWAAGVKAPEFLKDIDGLETNRINQLVVRPTLQTTRDDAIFAIGDCAACAWTGTDKMVPPRAQAAHQMASHLFRQLPRHLRGEPLKDFRYRDHGSLVSLAEYGSVGSMGKDMVFEGFMARMMYQSLYKMHELALHGWTKVTLDTIARTITRRTEPHVKLH